jgi:SulP family sulfate permease
VGQSAVIYQLSGYLFFGTASQLIQEIRSGLADPARRPRFVILDFRRISGIDASATFALIKLAKTCSAQEVELLFTSLSVPLRAEFLRANPEEGKPLQIAHHLDDALQTVEECLLATRASASSEDEVSGGFLEELERLHPGFGAEQRFSSVDIGAGQELFAQNSPPDGMGVLVSGRLRAEISGQDRTPVPVATIRPGALIGEIGLYANLPRTARVVAEEASRVLLVTKPALDELAATDPTVLADFHRLAAVHLARRLMRTNALLRDAEAS